MARSVAVITPEIFTTFGELLRYLRRRAYLSQRDLAVAVGYSEAQVSRLECNQRLPNESTLLAQFVPALDIEREPEWVARLLQLAAKSVGHDSRANMPHPSDAYPVATPEGSAGGEHAATTSTRPLAFTLPMQATSLVGREEERAFIRQRLERPDVRLLVLTGPGGTGKTRLALEVAAELHDLYADGVCFVALAAITDPALVVTTVADALGVTQSGPQHLAETVGAYLRDRQMLLVLDNFEQVVAAAPQIALWLGVTLRLKVLVTSREALQIYGEHIYAVPPLSLPPASLLSADTRTGGYDDRSYIAAVMRSEAVRLFVERAQAVEASFVLTGANVAAIAEICRRLDGLPLAIELAAARISMLPPQALLARLSRRLRLLTGGTRQTPARQQTLRATIEWSYNLLQPAEQRLFVQLAVFVGSFDLQAAESICGAEVGGEWAEEMVLDGLQALMNKQMIRPIADLDSGPRFMMLETIREFAMDQLVVGRNVETLRRRHASYFARFVEQTAPVVRSPAEDRWHERLERDHDNLRAALTWTQTQAADDDAAVGLRLAVALAQFWTVHGYFAEGQEWLERCLEQTARTAGGALDSLRAKAYEGAGTMLWAQGQYARASEFHEEARKLYEAIGDQFGVATALYNLAVLAKTRGDYTAALEWHDASLRLRRELGDKLGTADSLCSLGVCARDQGDRVRAAAHYEQSLVLFKECKDRRGIAFVLGNLGELAHDQGQYEQAAMYYEEARAVFQTFGDRLNLAYMQKKLGSLAHDQGSPQRAIVFFHAGLVLYRALGNTCGIAECLEGLASALYDVQHPTPDRTFRLVRLWGVAEALREVSNSPRPLIERELFTPFLHAVCAEIGDDAFATMKRVGRVMPVETAIVEAQELLPWVA